MKEKKKACEIFESHLSLDIYIDLGVTHMILSGFHPVCQEI